MTDEGIKTTVVYKTETGGPYTYQGDIYFDKDQAPNRPTTAVAQANRPKTSAKTSPVPNKAPLQKVAVAAKPVTEITDVIIKDEQQFIEKQKKFLNTVLLNKATVDVSKSKILGALSYLNPFNVDDFVKKINNKIDEQNNIRQEKKQNTDIRLTNLKSLITTMNDVFTINKKIEVQIKFQTILLYVDFLKAIDDFANDKKKFDPIERAKKEYEKYVNRDIALHNKDIESYNAGHFSERDQREVLAPDKLTYTDKGNQQSSRFNEKGGSSTKKRMNKRRTLSKRMRSHPYSKRTRAHKSTRLTKRRAHL